MEEFKLSDFIEMFNAVTGRRYRPIASYGPAFKARLAEGYKFEDFRDSVSNAAKDPFLRGANKHARDYLTPEYILRPGKFLDWLNKPMTKAIIGSPEYYD